MSTTRRAANRHTVEVTGWTNPENAYALSGDNTYATIDSAKSSNLQGSFGFPDITTAAGPDSAHFTSNSQSGGWVDVAYGNGYWVMVGSSGAMRYATDPTGAWTSNTQGTTTFEGVAYGNGYWVAVGSSGTLYYATDPTGAWTSNTQGTDTHTHVWYENGYWVITCATSASRIKYRTSDPTGAFTTNNTGGTDVLRSTAYGNGYWVAVGDNGALRYKATNPTGAWTSNAQGSNSFTSVGFGNGYWVAVGVTGTLYYATDPTGSWTSNAQGSDSFEGVAYGNGYWATGGPANAGLRYAADPSGSWPLTEWLVGGAFSGLAYGDERWVGVGGGNVTLWGVIGNPGIPDGSTINSVKVYVEWGMTASVTGGELTAAPILNNSSAGGGVSKVTTTEAVSVATFGTTPTLADLRAAETSDLVEVTLGCNKGSTNTAMTCNVDYVYLEVDFTPPAPPTGQPVILLGGI